MFTTVYDNLLNLERELGDAFGVIPDTSLWAGGMPAMNVADANDGLFLTFELPGVERSDIKIAVRDNVLSVSGMRKPMNLPEGSSWVKAETWNGSFARSIELPQQIDAGAITAELENGLLKLTLPKLPEAKPREISIR
jgi:HSP20 family protein